MRRDRGNRWRQSHRHCEGHSDSRVQSWQYPRIRGLQSDYPTDSSASLCSDHGGNGCRRDAICHHHGHGSENENDDPQQSNHARHFSDRSALLQTKSAELMAATGMDALSHALEAYVSSLSWPMTDPHAIHALELITEHLVDAVRYKGIEALEGMSIACLEAGIAFSNAILGAVHALAHPLGGFYDIHHGVANVLLLPVVLRKNLEYSPEKYARVAAAMGAKTDGMSTADAAMCLLEQLEKLIADLELPTRLSSLGVNQDDIPQMAALAQQDICMLTNPCCYSIAEIEELYREAW